jgi:ectoine hydroxylase-related dioxygenase (phytanoyl-CoA dioxygenase family)
MASFRQQGFEVIPDILDRVAVSSLLRAVVESAVPRSRAGMRGAMEVEAVREIAHDPRIMTFTWAALGEGAFPFRATLFDKSSDSNWLVPWHQDTALPLRERREIAGWGPWSVKEGVICAHAPACALENVLAIRIHLDDSHAVNGPLRVLPATHKSGVLSDDSIHELANKIHPVECPVRAGGLVLMKPLLIHASSKLIAGSRRVLHIEYSSQLHFSGGLELFTPQWTAAKT